MKNIAIVGLLACGLLFTGCHNNKAKTTATSASPSVMNTKCPFSSELVTEGITSDWNGKTVGFCCNGCKGKWDKLDDAKRTSMIQGK